MHGAKLLVHIEWIDPTRDRELRWHNPVEDRCVPFTYCIPQRQYARQRAIQDNAISVRLLVGFAVFIHESIPYCLRRHVRLWLSCLEAPDVLAQL